MIVDVGIPVFPHLFRLLTGNNVQAGQNVEYHAWHEFRAAVLQLYHNANSLIFQPNPIKGCRPRFAEYPVAKMERVVQHRRVRPLTKSGIVRLIAAINAEPSPVLRAAFLMLIYGFAPKSQVFSMRWSDLDFNHYMWGARPLSDAAVVLLQDLPQDGNWVFSVRGRMKLTDPRASWHRVAAAAGIPNLTMDDVHKFMMRHLVWASAPEDLRANMNDLVDEINSLNI